jgi:hypothetical protein
MLRAQVQYWRKFFALHSTYGFEATISIWFMNRMRELYVASTNANH